jgi:hypothetical protein
VSPNQFNPRVAVFISFNMLDCLYKPYTAPLYFTLHTKLT